MKTSIYFAPLQSYTTLPYYLAFNNLIGGVDKYFTPFYRADREGNFGIEKQLTARPQINIIPQVLTNSAEELLRFGYTMVDRGFTEINLNLGCPFPMLSKRRLGSGLLPHPNMLLNMMTAFFDTDILLRLSVKLRLGWEDSNEIKPVMEVLSQFPLEEIIVHPRLGIQQYKSRPNWDVFKDLSHRYTVVGNGDITSSKILDDLEQQFPDVAAWMIGRGLLANPCMLRPEQEWRNTMSHLHDLFLNNLREFGYSEHQILNHLKCFWEYPAQHLEGGRRLLRKIKKVGSRAEYEERKKNLLAG
ncbi:tRNA-U20a,U20b-dihydrouridine synthase [Saccharicrinis carchari]|uniref:tRNA-dihydrouridine synthase n=1 Tax=Saccharicrinis carchari TaxID=1168039 RepID=A0A521DXE5_SACCC|nr:tRNA-dihydrouridine synthase family protein [Saccharicrinis carchari]SMO76393.1 tRNA-U20a,U20b-dihydrouridine synthase [Saccharicrinis carchari]